MYPIISTNWRRLAIAWLAASVIPLIPLTGFAQEAKRDQRPDPLDAQAAVPAPGYRSSLQDYRPHAGQEVSAWKELNDATARVGGWRAYAKQAQQPDPAEAKPALKEAAAPDRPQPVDHSQHGKKEER
ncbi:MAG: hypothetical protein V4488_03035 [Pseudomonadota bacterium]